MKKVAIYKVVIGGYDTLEKELFSVTNDCENFQYSYYFFSDKKLVLPEPWVNIVVERKYEEDAVENRFYKLDIPSVLSDYDFTIYLDGNIYISSDIKNLLIELSSKNCSIFAYPHYIKHSLKDEIISCYLFSKISFISFITTFWSLRNDLKCQVEYECGVLIRKRATPKLKLLANIWFMKYYHGARRDQFYFSSALNEAGVQCNYLGPNDLRQASGLFKLKAHKKKLTFMGKLWIVFKVRAYNLFANKRKKI